jgi:hypothetical protein
MTLTPHTIAGLFVIASVYLIPLGLMWLAVRVIRHAWTGR